MASAAASTVNATNGRQKAKHQQRQAAAAAAHGPAAHPPSSTSSLSAPEASLLALLPSPISSLLPSLVSAPLSSLTLTSLQNHAITSGLIPDVALRRLSRYLLQQRYDTCNALDVEALAAYQMSFIQQLHALPIAVNTQAVSAGRGWHAVGDSSLSFAAADCVSPAAVWCFRPTRSTTRCPLPSTRPAWASG